MFGKIGTMAKFLAFPLTLALTFGSFPFGDFRASAYTSADADRAMKAYNEAFWDPAANMFWKSTNRDQHQDFWVEAELWELVMDAYLHTSDPELKANLRTQIDQVYEGTVAKYGEDWTNNPFNDDIMWWAMGSARAYHITGDDKYLEAAKFHFDFVYDTQWDEDFANGGIWWLNSDHLTKNACINFPAAQAALYLYDITRDRHYLDAAVTIFRWGKTMLTDGNGKVFDRIEVENGPIPDATHYNQGTFIGAAVGLYKITKDPVYLEDAVKAAEFTKNRLVDAEGILNYEGPNGDLKGGKTILMRNLAHLQQTLDETGSHPAFSRDFDEWLADNLETAWSHRNPDGIMDGNWAGQLLSGTYESWSSAAAVQGLMVIKPMQGEPRYAGKDPYQKLEAEKYSIGSGFVLEGALEGTLQLGGIRDGSYAAYNDVDFGADGAVGLIARAASGTGGGRIEVRLDALDGPKVGSLDVEGTGGWNNYIDAVNVLTDDQGAPSRITGKHDVYLVFKKKNDDYLFNLNWFKFTTTDPRETDAYAKLDAGNYDASEGLNRNPESGVLDTIRHGAYAKYERIDFGSGAAGVSVHVSSGNQGGTIEIRLDSPDGPTVGAVHIPALGGWDRWIDVMANIDDKRAVGVHDVYLVFQGKDGADYPCNLDWFTFTTMKGKARDAYGKLEAESYTSGVGFGRESGGGETYLAGVYGPDHPYAMYNFVDFGSASPKQFHVRAASDTAGGTIEARLDSISGPVIATATVSGTGGWHNFQVFQGDMQAPVTGQHIVFLLMKGEDYLYNLDKFTFGDPAVFTAPDPKPDPVPDSVPPGEVENIRTVREDDRLLVTWDGPYDLDAEKVEIALSTNGQPIGGVKTVNRGIQSAEFTGLEDGNAYTLFFRSVDFSRNKSQGVSHEVEGNSPEYTLTIGDRPLTPGTAFEDHLPLRFHLSDPSGVQSVELAVYGGNYTLDPSVSGSLEIDMAGKLGDNTLIVTLRDATGKLHQDTIPFLVETSLESMKKLLARYARSGELKDPLARLLDQTLDQAERQFDRGHDKQAIKQMQHFIKHLNNRAMHRFVHEQAKKALDTDASAVIRQWQHPSEY